MKNNLSLKLKCVTASLAVIAAGILTGCSSAKVTGTKDMSALPADRPTVIYVADFELQAEDIKHESGVVLQNSTSDSTGPVREIASGAPMNPQKRAKELVDLLSDSIVKDLKKSGFTAVRLSPADPMPSQGWIVNGIFTEVQVGNRLRRAIIGFGRGATDLQVVTSISDLSKGAPQPFYEIDTKADSGEKPGAIPTMILLNPISAAVHFVITGPDLNKNVKQTAKKIAEQVAKETRK